MFEGGYIEFERDGSKAELNASKHTVTFEEAAGPSMTPMLASSTTLTIRIARSALSSSV